MAIRIALLGTGRMGSALARRLAGAGAELTLWDRTADRATALGLMTSVPWSGCTVDRHRGGG